MANKPTSMYKLRLLLKHYHAGASKRWLAGVLEISRSTLNVYWTRKEHLNLDHQIFLGSPSLRMSSSWLHPIGNFQFFSKFKKFIPI